MLNTLSSTKSSNMFHKSFILISRVHQIFGCCFLVNIKNPQEISFSWRSSWPLLLSASILWIHPFYFTIMSFFHSEKILVDDIAITLDYVMNISFSVYYFLVLFMMLCSSNRFALCFKSCYKMSLNLLASSRSSQLYMFTKALMVVILCIGFFETVIWAYVLCCNSYNKNARIFDLIIIIVSIPYQFVALTAISVWAMFFSGFFLLCLKSLNEKLFDWRHFETSGETLDNVESIALSGSTAESHFCICKGAASASFCRKYQEIKKLRIQFRDICDQAGEVRRLLSPFIVVTFATFLFSLCFMVNSFMSLANTRSFWALYPTDIIIIIACIVGVIVTAGTMRSEVRSTADV